MPKENSLLDHLEKILNHPNVSPAAPLRVAVQLNSGQSCSGTVHALFEDGFVIINNSRLTYVPLTGVTSLSVDHPGTPSPSGHG